MSAERIRAQALHDGLPPEQEPEDRITIDLQMSINAALTRRIVALEKRIKELELRQAV